MVFPSTSRWRPTLVAGDVWRRVSHRATPVRPPNFARQSSPVDNRGSGHRREFPVRIAQRSANCDGVCFAGATRGYLDPRNARRHK
jgi:hypothetical protein